MAKAAERAHRARWHRTDAGFTLVELMIAVFMLSIGILAVGRMFIMAQRHATYGRTETMAVSLAQEIREKILSKDFDDLETLFDGVDTRVPGTVTAPCQLWAAHLTTGLGANGRGRLTVRNPTEDPEIVDGMLTVLIDVSWLENGSTKSAAMHFSLSRMGV
jgi:prepilin-type N-terminal cleavage/methylation domain-containing protein